jgi:hypothetical protein
LTFCVQKFHQLFSCSHAGGGGMAGMDMGGKKGGDMKGMDMGGKKSPQK